MNLPKETFLKLILLNCLIWYHSYSSIFGDFKSKTYS